MHLYCIFTILLQYVFFMKILIFFFHNGNLSMPIITSIICFKSFYKMLFNNTYNFYHKFVILL
uniref:Uncharacterized protein n=1 Tax=Physcomitrium patens TaxID=3218 RepID=A0A2K1L7V4_PHYPA|nr:hypothetical protein PHYPA_000552 [Physcomitrium patens]PNR62133.1 hypothetical protein PHYPA_000557 [Physcomitrium patens]